LNACYSDVQGDAISANIPFTIGMRDRVADNVAIKFSQGFYDAIGAGKGYENAFKWGKVAIEFDLADDQASQILVLRKKGDSFSQSSPVPTKPSSPLPLPQRSLSASEYFNRALKKQNQGDKQGAIADYNESIRLKPDFAEAYNNRGIAKDDLGDKQGAIADYNEAIRLKPDYAEAYNNRGNAKYDLGDKQGAIADYNEAIRLKPDFAEAYYSRGLIKEERGEKQEALADFRKAAELYQQQGNTEWYNNSLDRIKELGG